MSRFNQRQWEITAHVLFWIGYVIFISFLITQFLQPRAAFFRTIIMAIFHALLVYSHLYILLPRFFEQKKYRKYVFSLVMILLLSVVLRIFADYTLARLAAVESALLFSRTHILGTIISSVIILLITFPLKMIQYGSQKEILQEELKTQRLEAELKFLKAQVNPHFLFNTLNNIYTLAFTQSEQTAPTIMKLSEMMRYMLYECRAERVPLLSEVHYLQNFIELQQLKTPDHQNITFEIEGKVNGIMIPPLLFVPLVENAFKHGNPTDIHTGWVKANLSVSAENIVFSIRNSLPSEIRKDKVGGIGLENIRNRLELIYPHSHKIDIQTAPDQFSVTISIPKI
ncbi:MAG: histidine kinase [Bacteroidia bacterium]|nr:histidine kinase [Bacteroidia bacterium]